MGRIGQAMHDANNRHTARRAKERAYKKALKEAELRNLEDARKLQPSLKAACMARNPNWFQGR